MRVPEILVTLSLKIDPLQHFYLSRLSLRSVQGEFNIITTQHTLNFGSEGRVKISPHKTTKTFVFKLYNLTENASHVPIKKKTQPAVGYCTYW